jgi:hypothetical protein
MPDPKVGDRVVWPNGRTDRFMRPRRYQRGEVVALNEGVGGECLKVKDDRGGFYYPLPRRVWLEEDFDA